MENPNAEVFERERYDESNLGALGRLLSSEGNVYGGNIFRFEASRAKYHEKFLESFIPQGELPRVKILYKNGLRQINKEADGYKEALLHSKKYKVDILAAANELGFDLFKYEYPKLKLIEEDDEVEAVNQALHPEATRLAELEDIFKAEKNLIEKKLEKISLSLINSKGVKRKIIERDYNKVSLELENINSLIEQNKSISYLYKDEDEKVSEAASYLYDQLEKLTSYNSKSKAIYMGNISDPYFDLVPEKNSYLYKQIFRGLDMEIDKWEEPYEFTFGTDFHRYYKDAGDNLIDDTLPMDGTTVRYDNYGEFLKVLILVSYYPVGIKEELIKLVNYKSENQVVLKQEHFLKKVEDVMHNIEVNQMEKTRLDLTIKEKEFIGQYRHLQKFLSEIEEIYIDAKEGKLQPRLAVYPHQFEEKEFLIDIVAKMKSKLFNLTQEDSFYTSNTEEIASEKTKARIKAISWKAIKDLRKAFPKMILLKNHKGEAIDINVASPDKLKELPFAFNKKIISSLLAERPFDSVTKISKQCPSISPVIVDLWRSRNIVFLTNIIKKYQQNIKGGVIDTKIESSLYAEVKSAKLPQYDVTILAKILNWRI